LRRALTIIALLLGAAVHAAAQYGLAPAFDQQFFSNTGLPLIGGQIYTCYAGTSCPGNPLASYTDSTGAVQNSNPVVLDGFGRASIWLTCSLAYKLVLQDAMGNTLVTSDNQTCGSGGGGGGGTNYWTLSGSTIYNNNGGGTEPPGGAGNVQVGADFIAGGNLWAGQSLRIASSTAPNHFILRANSGMASDVTWRWAQQDAMGCLASDGMGNLSFQACGAGLTPGGSNGNVQFNSNGYFGGNSNFNWNNTSQLLTVVAQTSSVAGIAVGTGYVQADAGFLATPSTATQYDVVNAPGGGMYALSFTAANYIQSGFGATNPTMTPGDSPHPGALYWNTTSGAEQVFNGTAWVSLGGGSGSAGGSNTDVQFNSSGALGGSGNFTWNNGSRLLTVTSASSGVAGIAVGTGYIQADAGFLATPGTAMAYDSIQAPGGGFYGKSFTALNYIQTGNGTAIPTLTSGDSPNAGWMYYNTTNACEELYSGTAWSCLGMAGSSSPGAPNSSVQFNNSGALGGSANLMWNNGSQLLTVTAASSSVAGIAVATGFVQADEGFIATSGTGTQYNVIQAPGGGMAAKSFTAANYIQTGSGTVNPTATTGDTFNPGALYYNTANACETLYNGSAWACIGGGSGGGPFPSTYFIPAANCVTGAPGSGWSISSGGSASCRSGVHNVGGYIAISDTSSTFASFQVEIPLDWDTGVNPYIRFQLASTDTASGHTIIPQIQVACYKGDGTTTDDVVANAAHSSSTVTLNGNANAFWATSNVQMNSTDVTGCVGGSLMQVTVGRATDTATSAEFYGATITFPRSIMVQPD